MREHILSKLYCNCLIKASTKHLSQESWLARNKTLEKYKAKIVNMLNI